MSVFNKLKIFLNISPVRCFHIYKTVDLQSSEWAEKLCSDIIYNKNGVVVLNKPYGISFSQSDCNSDENEVSLKTILPFIKNLLGYSQLLNVKVPERYISGVAIFCTDEDSFKNVKMCFNKMKLAGKLQDTYKAIVVGYPQFQTGNFKGAITLQTSSLVKNEKKVNFVTEWSNNSLKRGDIKKVKLAHTTIKEGKCASLVEINSNRNKWHCVRAYLASKLLSPVLGDNIFGSRVKTLLGSAVPVDVFSPFAMLPQKVPAEIKKMLDLEGRKDIAIPLHLHLSSVTLDSFEADGSSVEFTASLPDVFNWTCYRLSLS